MSNYYRAVELLKKVGVYPADLAPGVADGRWPLMAEKLRLVEQELDEAEKRGAAETEKK